MNLQASVGALKATLDLSEAGRWDDERVLASERGEGRRFAVWPIVIASPAGSDVVEFDVDDGPRNFVVDDEGQGDVAVLSALLRAAIVALPTADGADAEMLDAFVSGKWARWLLSCASPGLAKAGVDESSALPVPLARNSG